MVWGGTRVIALLLILLSIYVTFPDPYKLLAWDSTFYAVLVGHYILAAYYARRRIGEFISRPNSSLYILVLVAITLWLYSINWVTVFFIFAVHFGLSEAYSKRIQDPDYLPGEDRVAKIFVFNHFALNCAIFLAAFWHTFNYAHGALKKLSDPIFFNIIVLLIAMMMMVQVYLLLMRHSTVFKKEFSLVNFSSYLVPELLYISLIPFFREREIFFSAGIFYHLAFWFLAPLTGMIKMSSYGAMLRYLFVTVVVTGGLLLLTPFMTTIEWSFLYNINESVIQDRRIFWLQFTTVFGHMHIYTSFFSSSLNPSWLLSFNDKVTSRSLWLVTGEYIKKRTST